MISIEDVKKKALRQYGRFLQSVLVPPEAEPFFPLQFPAGSAPKDYMALRDAVKALMESSKAKTGSGYELLIEQRNTRQHGAQSIPRKVVFETATDFLKFLRKETEFSAFNADVALIQSQMPSLNDWVYQYPLKVVDHHGSWPDLIKVCQYFEQHPQPNLYVRELPIAVHTKFVEENKKILRSLLEEILPAATLIETTGESDHTFEKRFSLRYPEHIVRIRFLDDALRKRHRFPSTDFALPLSDFAQLSLGNPRCVISENLMPFLTLPPMENAIAIFGAGYAVTQLKAATWLTHCPIFYWSDMDVDGFRMLSAVRSHFPQTQSVLMDSATYEQFEAFSVDVNVGKTDGLEQLNNEEKALCDRLIAQRKRLEQERIAQSYVNQVLRRCLS